MSKQFYLLSIQRRLFQAKVPSIVASSALAGMVAMNIVHNANNTTQSDSSASSSSSSSSPSSPSSPSSIIETDFLEKIASKSYLNYHNPFARDSIITSALNTSKKVWNKLARSDISPSPSIGIGDYFDKDNVMRVVGGSKQLYERPRGVPRRVRIMAIDVPEFRQVFDGECRVNLSRVYPDGIAPSKFVQRKKEGGSSKSSGGNVVGGEDNSNNNNNNDHSSSSSPNPNASSGDKKTKKKKKKKKKKKNDKEDEIEIIQKSLARSLVRCRNVQSKRIGVELLESSVYDLNPHNMRRTYQFGSYRYDPGKYGSMKKMPGDDMLQRRITAYGGVPRDGHVRSTKPRGSDREKDLVVTKNKTHQDEDRALGDVEDITDQDENDETGATTVLANEEDEVDAPWNQTAWIEEMELRIHGRVPFGASVERTSWFTRKLFGKNFRSTVKATYSSPFLWLVPSFVIGHRPGGYEGIDGDYGKNKRTVNRASSKPHAVIADGSAMQRVPGSLRYLTKCCQEADVPLFIINDPRVWGGNTHIDLESAAKDMRKTIKARIVANALTIKEGSMFERGRILGKLETETKWQMKDAGRRTRDAIQSAAARLQREREENWNELSSEELLQRLIDRQILQNEGGKIKDIGTREAFAELCRQFLTNQEKAQSSQQQQQEQQSNTIPKDKGNDNHDSHGEKDNSKEMVNGI